MRRNSMMQNLATNSHEFNKCMNGRTQLDSRQFLASRPRDGQRPDLRPRTFSAHSITVRRQHGSPSASLDASGVWQKRMLRCAAAPKSIRLSAPAMVVLEVSTPLLGAVAVASLHGLTDLQRSPKELIPYGIMFLPISSDLVTLLFIGCSIQHFSRDIGIRFSLLLHTVFIALGPFFPQAAWIIFSLYYCLCHAPLHCIRHASKIDVPLAVAIVAAAVISAFGLRGVEVFQLTDAMQLGVIAHIVVDELQISRVGHTDVLSWGHEKT